MAQHVGMFAYTLVANVLSPIMVATDGDDYWLAAYATDRKGSTIPGSVIDEIDIEARTFLTFAQVSRAARKAGTAVILGRSVEILPKSRFGKELARLSTHDLREIVTAGWRLDSGDLSSNELDAIYGKLEETYIQA